MSSHLPNEKPYPKKFRIACRGKDSIEAWSLIMWPGTLFTTETEARLFIRDSLRKHNDELEFTIVRVK